MCGCLGTSTKRRRTIRIVDITYRCEKTYLRQNVSAKKSIGEKTYRRKNVSGEKRIGLCKNKLWSKLYVFKEMLNKYELKTIVVCRFVGQSDISRIIHK